MMLLSLFWAFLQIGATSVGGGYAAMPLIRQQVCLLHPWLTEAEFSHLVTIAEMTPVPSPSMPPPLWAPAWQGSPAQ